MLTLVMLPLLLLAQSSSQSQFTQGRKIFGQRCAVCHGPDAHGAERGPALTGNRRLRKRSVQQIRDVISTGLPATGMPAFELPPAELDAVSAFVHSLNSSAAETRLPGRRIQRMHE